MKHFGVVSIAVVSIFLGAHQAALASGDGMTHRLGFLAGASHYNSKFAPAIGAEFEQMAGTSFLGFGFGPAIDYRLASPNRTVVALLLYTDLLSLVRLHLGPGFEIESGLPKFLLRMGGTWFFTSIPLSSGINFSVDTSSRHTAYFIGYLVQIPFL